ncbi:MAG: sodium:proton antiporter [Methyloceanibacter sp.]|jgi:CPA1 family monovalent cation:H+ antiporter
MDTVLTHTTAFLGVAILVAIIARRVHLPYTVGLVVAGVGLAATRLETGAMLTHDFIFEVILPPLLFEAALSIHWRELRRDMLPIVVLSTFGVCISAVVVAAGLMTFLAWPAAAAIVFGVLIGATDPIAVLAMFKDTGIGGRVRLLVESESLFNDGVAAVLFVLVVTWVQATDTAQLTTTTVTRTLVLMTGGGILVGIASGGAAIALARHTSDHLVETALTAVAAYGSFLLAENLHFSGVLATVAAGLLMGNLGVLREDEDQNLFSSGGRSLVIAFWEFAAFIANSLVFLLIGLRVAAMPFTGIGAKALLIAVGLVLMGRALTVYPLCLLFQHSAWAIPMRDQHVLWWGGLRGALALALTLALSPSFPFYNEILITAFGVVAFSVVVQGLTMPLVLRKLNFLPNE